MWGEPVPLFETYDEGDIPVPEKRGMDAIRPANDWQVTGTPEESGAGSGLEEFEEPRQPEPSRPEPRRLKSRPLGPQDAPQKDTKKVFSGTTGPGKRFKSVKPFEPAPVAPTVKRQCTKCLAPAPTQVCIGCGAGFYCDAECQQRDWPVHASKCSNF